VSAQDQTPPILVCQARADLSAPCKGNFRTMKWWLLAAMLGIYYVLPWIRWDRGPDMPNQAVLAGSGQPALLFLHDRNLAA
jgi:polyferredoxin